MQLVLEQTQAEGVLSEAQTRMCLPPKTLPAGSIEVAHYSAPALGRTAQTLGALLNRADAGGQLGNGLLLLAPCQHLPWSLGAKNCPPLRPAVVDRDTPRCSILPRLARTDIERAMPFPLQAP